MTPEELEAIKADRVAAIPVVRDLIQALEDWGKRKACDRCLGLFLPEDLVPMRGRGQVFCRGCNAEDPGRYEKAWRVSSTTDPNEFGVLVQWAGDDGYWWLLCPAGATLYFYDVEVGCSLGLDCDWEDVHEAAVELSRNAGATA